MDVRSAAEIVSPEGLGGIAIFILLYREFYTAERIKGSRKNKFTFLCADALVPGCVAKA
jgi:hypothetical protein